MGRGGSRLGGGSHCSKWWWSRRDDRKGALPCAPIFEARPTMAMACGRFLRLPSSLPPCAVVWRRLQFRSSSHFICSYQTQHLCLGAVPFPFSFPPFLIQFLPALSIPPSRSSFPQASQTTKVQQILSLLPSLSPSRLLATTTLRLLTRKVCRACASFCWLAWYIVFFPVRTRKGGGRAAPHPSFVFFFSKEKMRW